ncbi:retrotransposon protein, putative, unclassified [Tanacetum coccineum]
MFIKFLSKYFPYSRTVQLRKEILNFRQLPTESVFEAWERFKSCLRKCPDHRILLLNQILTFYNGITMIDQERFMVAAGGNFMRKTPQEAYDLIENMTQHHFQWDAEVYYNTTTDMSAHYSETTFASRERVEVLGKQTGYTIQSVQHNPGPGHPNTFYYSDSDESDDDEPSEMIEDQKSVHHLSGSPTPSSDPVVASLSPLPTPFGDSDSLLEETDTLLSHSDDYIPDYETFFFNIKEKISGSTTTHSDYSLPDYEAFYFDDDHIEEKSSGSTTTHSDFSLPEYDSFIFDLLIDLFPPADRSVSHHEEFADELAHIIFTPEYDRFYFELEIDLGESTSVVEKNIFDLSSTKDSTSIELNDFPLLLSDCDSIFFEKFFEIDLLVIFPSRDKDKVFDLEILAINRVHCKRFSILFMDDFSSILFVRDFLILTDPSKIKTFLSFPFRNEYKVFDPRILIIDGVFSFTRKSPHLLINNFKIDKCHILSEISLMTDHSVSFLPNDN